jgi:hypothetical protein
MTPHGLLVVLIFALIFAPALPMQTIKDRIF